MAALHTALQALSPTDFTSVPLHDLGGYLHETFSRAQVLIDSVPLPGPESVTPTARSRSNTVSSIASNASEISASSARSADPVPEHISLQKEWGKALKLGAKENPLGISVYKLSGKDGKGAWFARRSVHEGLGFAKWKRGLEREFPESMAVQGGPGQGNIRGIGGEKRVEREIVAGVGKMEVYHLSAQFPGPTTPRDFVTLLLTTDSALPNTSNGAHTSHPNTLSPSLSSTLQEPPRHYMVISKPCNHPSCPPRDGFIRGQYESVEYIREIPLKPGNRASRSTNDLRSAGTGTGGRTRASSIGREAMLRSATQRTATFPAQIDGLNGSKVAGQIPTPPPSPSSSLEVMAATEGRRRGATISYSAPRAARSTDGNLHVSHEEEDDESEMNPVEWIMITRSDPGGSVPRFMVERGTPGSIVADASKFLDWACSAEHPEGEDEIETVVEGSVLRKEEEKVDALHLNAHLSGIDGTTEGVEDDEHQQPTISGLSATNVTPAAPLVESATTKDTEAYQPTKEALAPPAAAPHQHSLYESVTSTLGAGLTAITPTMISSHFPTYHPSPRPSSLTRSSSSSSNTSVTSTVSFATANSATSSQARTSNDRDSSPSSSALPNAADAPTTATATAGEPSTDTTSLTKSSTAASVTTAAQDKELLKLQERRRKLDEKLEKSRLSLLPVPSTSSSSSTTTSAAAGVPAPADPPPPAAWTKALASHARDVQKLELRYARELEKIQARRERDARKENEREKKRVDRDERAKLARERDEAKSELARVRAERDALRVVVGELQRENTGLVARFGGGAGTAGGGGLDIGTGEGGSRAPTPRLA